MRNWTGKKLKAVRETQGLSQKTLARRIEAPQGEYFINWLENGVHPTFETLLGLADALEVPVALIYEGKTFG